MKEMLDRLVMVCQDILADNLVCVLWLGSASRNDATPFSDFDVVAVVRTFNIVQVLRISKIVPEFNRPLDLNIVCLDEIQTDRDEVTMGTNGCYYWHFALRQAVCLAGKNIFSDWPEPDSRKLRQSVLNKITQYAYWARGLALSSKTGFSIEVNHRLNIRIIKAVRDFMFLVEASDIEASNTRIINLFLKNHNCILEQDEQTVLLRLADNSSSNLNASDLSETYLGLRLSILSKLHKAALAVL